MCLNNNNKQIKWWIIVLNRNKVMIWYNKMRIISHINQMMINRDKFNRLDRKWDKRVIKRIRMMNKDLSQMNKILDIWYRIYRHNLHRMVNNSYRDRLKFIQRGWYKIRRDWFIYRIWGHIHRDNILVIYLSRHIID